MELDNFMKSMFPRGGQQAARQAAQLQQKAGLSPLNVPVFPAAFAQLLAKTFENVAADVERRVGTRRYSSTVSCTERRRRILDTPAATNSRPMLKRNTWVIY